MSRSMTIGSYPEGAWWVVPHTTTETFDASDLVHLLVASAARQLVSGSLAREDGY